VPLALAFKIIILQEWSA